MKEYYTTSEVADMLSVTKETLKRWVKNGKVKQDGFDDDGAARFHISQLKQFAQVGHLFKEKTDNKVTPDREYRSIELFAGAGGLALGFEEAGIECNALNEIDKWACATLRANRPNWNVLEGSITEYDFKEYAGRTEIVAGGFPCQAFSYAGKKLGLEDARGTLFYEFARVVDQVKPLVCVGENVRGLLAHDGGRTLAGMVSILEELGYNVYTPQVLKAIFYKVPQKRERLILIGVRKDVTAKYEYPKPYGTIYNLGDALRQGELFDTDVPDSPGEKYNPRKKEIMDMVPPGGCWRHLPDEIQREYMKGSYFLGGGKTGMARRISWDEPCLTLTCAPAMKQTERCHPDETRPFTVREYARIQTFPDNWEFKGSVSQQYKQIGNAVPVNLGREVGYSVVKLLNDHFKTVKAQKKELKEAKLLA